MNRINRLFEEKDKVLSIYLTAGYPNLEDTVRVIQTLEASGVDLIEIGLPFSDPLADGPTIQASSTQALKNGMTTQVLFDQIREIRNTVSIPLIIMGYFNPMLQFGVESFLKECSEIGIDGLIIPDLPLDEYKMHYASLFDSYDIKNILLVTPQTSDDRIHNIDRNSNAFIYAVSSASTTGAKNQFSEAQVTYLKRLSSMGLSNPLVVGFGISNASTFSMATAHTNGAIIGSAFIKMLTSNGVEGIPNFIESLRVSN